MSYEGRIRRLESYAKSVEEPKSDGLCFMSSLTSDSLLSPDELEECEGVKLYPQLRGLVYEYYDLIQTKLRENKLEELKSHANLKIYPEENQPSLVFVLTFPAESLG